MTGPVHPRSVGGRLLDRTMVVLLGLFAAGAAVIAYRFAAGIGPVSNMNDGYTWGIWEPVNVVVFTGIGAGAYAVGLLCYVLNRGEYHPLVRPAVLLGVIAYALGGASVIVALGRYWNVYWLAVPGLWNLNSVLLEVAVCVVAYLGVLWVEVMPAALERAAASPSPARAAWGRRWSARLARWMPFIIALAMVLPTMHQSSLGGLLLIAGPKVHPLWHTALLPLLALVSCLSMGCGAVVVVSALMRRAWNAHHDPRLLADLTRVNAGFLALFVALRLTDLAARGKLRPLAPDHHLLFFALETALFLVPATLALSRRVRTDARWLAGIGAAAVAGGALWRIDAFIVCYDPGPAWRYVPSLGELAVTVGMAAAGAATFIGVARRMPVVALAPTIRAAEAAAPAPRAAQPALAGGARMADGSDLRRIGLALWATWRKLGASARRGARELAATVTPRWVPGETHLAGRASDARAEANRPAPSAAPDGMDALAREIAARRRTAPHR